MTHTHVCQGRFHAPDARRRVARLKPELVAQWIGIGTVHESWDALRFRRNQIHRITTVLPKSKHRYIVLKVDQKLTPFLQRIIHCLGMSYDPAATRSKEEYSSEPSDLEKPPNP